MPTDRRRAPTGGGPDGGEGGGEDHRDHGAGFDVVTDAPGIEEVAVLPWPLLLRHRVHGRVQRSDKYPWLVLTAALVGLFSVGFSITVLNVSLPNIAADLDTNVSIAAWVITGPILLGAVVTPVAGKLADLYGARRVYLVAMACVTLFAALAAGAWSIGSLIAFRVLGAAIGAATGPASVSVINRLFGPDRRAQALGYWALVAAGAPVVGVVVGGPVVEHVSWRWVFVAQVPLALCTLVVCALVFPDTPRDRSTRFDAVGATLLALGAGALVGALNRAPEPGWGWAHPLVFGGLVLAPCLLATFAWWERRVPDRQLLPLAYLRNGNVTLPMVNLFLMNVAYMGGFFITPLLLKDELGFSESKIGLLSIARPLTFAIVGPFAGWLATRVGERVNGVVGAIFGVASMLVFAAVGASSSELVVIAALMLSGVAMGTTAPAMATAIANSVADRDLGVAGGAEQMLGQLGAAVGAQVMFTVHQSSGGSYSSAYLVGAGAAVLAVGAASFVRPTVARAARAPARERGAPQGAPSTSEPVLGEEPLVRG